MSENGANPRYNKGQIHIFQVPGGVIVINDDHVLSINLTGPGSQVFLNSDEERQGTINALFARESAFVGKEGPRS